MQIAKLFGSLGFKVDTSGLNDFTTALKTARQQIKLFANDTDNVVRNVKSISSSLRTLKKDLNLDLSTSKVTQKLTSLDLAVKNTAKQMSSFSASGSTLEKSLSSIESKVASGVPVWEKYRKEVQETATALRSIRGNSIPTPKGSGSNSYNHGGNNGSYGRANANGGALYTAGLAGGNFFNTARQAIVGGVATAVPFALGALTSNVIRTGREMRSADQVLLAHSEDKEEYKNNSRYITALSDETGVDITESIRGFGRVLSASKAGGGTVDDAQNVFASFARYGTTMHLSVEEQKRLIKALEQTYTNGRILGQEINQFANVGVPMKAILKTLSKGSLGGDSKEVVPEWVQKLAGSKAPDAVKLNPWIAKYLENTARQNGAYDKAITSSQAEQGRFGNQFTKFSSDIMENGGDEALASFFRLLTSVVNEMSRAVKGLRAINENFDRLTKVEGSNKFLWLLLALFLPLGRVAKGISAISRAFSVYRRHSRIAQSLTGTLGSRFARLIPLISVAFKWVWRLGGRWIWFIGVIQAVIEIGDALRLRDEGEITWIDIWILKAQILGAEINYLYQKAKVFLGMGDFTYGVNVDGSPRRGRGSTLAGRLYQVQNPEKMGDQQQYRNLPSITGEKGDNILDLKFDIHVKGQPVESYNHRFINGVSAVPVNGAQGKR